MRVEKLSSVYVVKYHFPKEQLSSNRFLNVEAVCPGLSSFEIAFVSLVSRVS